MGVLSSFERRLSTLVEGAFAKVFKGGVEPVEIAGALQRECDDRKVVSARRVLVPNAFVVELGDRDHERLVPYAEPLGDELAAMVREHADEQGYSFAGPVTVHLAHDGGLDTGVFRVHAEVSASGALATPEAQQPAPASPGTPTPPVPEPSSAAAQGGPPPVPSAWQPAARGEHAAQPLQVQPGQQGRPPAPAVPAAQGQGPGTPTAQPRLVLTTGGHASERSPEAAGVEQAFPLTASVVRLGRAQDVDLRLDDPSVSRHHAEVRRLPDGRHLVVDLGSTNGTSVNGTRVTTQELADGDRVALGTAEVVYRRGD